ncbi:PLASMODESMATA CALLOSE-BINDING PROTEIN 1-like [Miscanthus floridulus]|uniref:PLASMODESMATA CALLOSE-BINDING PROTEIN 1-like n=1 Tax=Miscanthus floridulus TaxID=154761 RepID=UPI00345B4C31
MGHRLFNPLGFLLAIVVLYGGTEQRRAEAADGASPHRLLTTISVSKPSYPTVTTPMSAYADPVSTPGTPYSTFPSLATGNGGAGAGAGTGGGGGAGGGGGGGGGGAGAGGGSGGGGGGGTWCVASPSASPTALQVALDYACGYGADCSAIQQGGSCFNPDTVHDHASFAFNSYYQKNPAPTSCDFGGTATITNTDPSSGSCQYPSSSGGGQNMMPPPSPTTMPPTVPPTPMTPTPPTPDTTPVYGLSPPDYGSMPPPGPGYGSTSPPDYNDVGAAATVGQGSAAALAPLCVLIATVSLHVSK